MTPGQKNWIPLLFFLLLLSLGCVTPSLPFLDGGADAVVPTTVDADTLATLVADAAAQKVSQTLEALPPTPFPTATPTETPQPSPTPTEVPPTATPTSTPYPETGSELLNVEDGVVYYDYSGGYRVDLPANWLALRPGEAEYTEAWSLPVAAAPEVQTALQNMQSLHPNTFRLFLLDTQEGHFDNGFLTKINFVLGEASG